MVHYKYARTISSVAAAALLVGALVVGCGGRGDTDGGKGNDDAGIGTQYVSDGGAGATLEINVRGGQYYLPVADTTGFSVTARDPQGNPLQYIRIFCESEHGIAILEPSSGGVAFEHTNAEGMMSGVIGGLTPGSYILECRAPIGLNLTARAELVITGEVPAGFDGWPGAAGGNLGGGLIVDPPEEDLAIRQILVTTPSSPAGSPNGPIDVQQDNCASDPAATPEPEVYIFNDYIVKLVNGREDRVFVDTVSFNVMDPAIPGGVTVTTQFNNLLVNGNSSVDLVGTFTTTEGGEGNIKVWPGTNTRVNRGVYNVTFTINGQTDSGQSFRVTSSMNINVANVNNCDS